MTGVSEKRFDMEVTDEERRTFRVMLSFTVIGAIVLLVTFLDPVRSAIDWWMLVSFYVGGVIIGGVIGMLFIWFVNTDGIMVNLSSLAMLMVGVIGFGIVIVSVILFVVFPGFFSENALMFGLGLSTIVFATGIQ